MCVCGWKAGSDVVDRSPFWEICEAHAKLDAETIVFSGTAGFIVNVLFQVNTDSIGHGKRSLTSNKTSSVQASVFL